MRACEWLVQYLQGQKIDHLRLRYGKSYDAVKNGIYTFALLVA